MRNVDISKHIEKINDLDLKELKEVNDKIQDEINNYSINLKKDISKLQRTDGNMQFNKLIKSSISEFNNSLDFITRVQNEIESSQRILNNTKLLSQKYMQIDQKIKNNNNVQNSIAGILPLYEEDVNTIFIIGKNGSGKSRYLREINDKIDSKQFVYIPAYREYNKNQSSGRPPKTSSLRDGFKLYNKKNNHYNTIEEILESINQEYFDSIMRKKMEEKYQKIKEMWKEIFNENSELDIIPKTTEVKLLKDNNSIDSARFSDGEYNILVILLICMFMPEASYIAIDEIELHLNMYQLKNMITSLIQARSDIQFLITTHNYYLIREFSDKSIFYMSNSALEKIVNIEALENDPEKIYDFIFEEKLIFCEGTAETDIQLYKRIFPDYQVVASGSCEQVKEIVRTLQNEYCTKPIYGIIDRDYLNEEEIENYKQQNIITLPYRHKENFMISEFNLNLFLEYLNDEFSSDIIKGNFEKFRKEIESGNRTTNFKNDYKYYVTKNVRNAISKGKDLEDIKNKIINYIQNEYPSEEQQPLDYETYLIKNPRKNNIKELHEDYHDWFISKLDNLEMANRLREKYFTEIVKQQ